RCALYAKKKRRSRFGRAGGHERRDQGADGAVGCRIAVELETGDISHLTVRARARQPAMNGHRFERNFTVTRRREAEVMARAGWERRRAFGGESTLAQVTHRDRHVERTAAALDFTEDFDARVPTARPE